MNQRSNSPEAIIRFNHLTKDYGGIRGVADLDFSVRKGEIFGFLGPNGAGKTTTILLMLGVIAPSSGEVYLFGQEQSSSQIALRRRLGVVLERQAVYPDLTGYDYLQLFGRLYGVRNLDARIQEVLELVGLADRMDTRVGGYSRGMQLKLGMARALLPDPEIFILDEPVEGLDPNSIREVRDILLRAHREGKTIFLSSHLLTEVERIADRVGVLNQGRLLAVGSMAALRDHYRRERRLLIEVAGDLPPDLKALEALPFVQEAGIEEGKIAVVVSVGEDHRPAIARAMVESGIAVINITSVEMSLEQVYANITSDNVELLASSAAGDAADASRKQKHATAESPADVTGGRQNRWNMIQALFRLHFGSTLSSPALYAWLAVALGITGAVLNSYLGFTSANGLLLISQPWQVPVTASVYLLTLYLAISAAVTLVHERSSGTLLVLFFGPVDIPGYLAGLFLSRVAIFGVTLMMVVSGVLAYLVWGGMYIDTALIARSFMVAFIPLCLLVSAGLWMAAFFRSVRSALLGFLGVIALVEVIQWAEVLLVQAGSGQRSNLLAFAQQAVILLSSSARWISPFQYFSRGLQAPSTGEALVIAAVGLVLSAVFLVAAAFTLRRRTVLP